LNALDGANQIAVVSRNLVILLLGRAIHPRAQPFVQLLRFAAEEEHDVVDHLAIDRTLGESDDARAEALVHVVRQTRTRQRILPLGDIEIAAPQLELIADELEDASRGAGEERTVIEIA